MSGSWVRLSYYDTLTGFYNRNRYIRDINRQAQADGSFGIAYLDVNGLKDINDYYGHDYGDQVLASWRPENPGRVSNGGFLPHRRR